MAPADDYSMSILGQLYQMIQTSKILGLFFGILPIPSRLQPVRLPLILLFPLPLSLPYRVKWVRKVPP